MMNKLNLLFAVIVFVTIDNDISCKECRKLKVSTYNTKLGDIFSGPVDSTIENAREVRRDKIIEALNNADSDFVCLQEVWYAEDVAAIVQGVRNNYKYSFSKSHSGKRVEAFLRPGEEPLCNPDLLINFSDCIIALCIAVASPEEALMCFELCFQDVVADLPPISEDCFTCFFAGFLDFDSLFEECGGFRDGGNFRKINANGLLILSKKKFSETRSVDFFPSTTEVQARGYLSADICDLKAVCTQMNSFVLDLFPSYLEPGLAEKFGFTSYAEQNAFQAEMLIKTFGNAKKAILLGDFNTGPGSIPGVQEVFEESYNALSAAFNTTPVMQCTFCSVEENPLSFNENSYTTSHVFTKGFCIWNASRIFTQMDNPFLLDSQVFPLSGHYGVQAKLLPQRACRSLKYRP